MPTIVTHPAVPLALGLGLGTQVVSPRLLAASAVASILPDADVAAFWFGIASLRRVQRSSTTSPAGLEQQMSTLPAAGGSSGSGS
jgi:hypothetical protein